MPVSTPGRESEAPSLVVQELSTQADLSASAGLPPVDGRGGIAQAFRALQHRNFRLFAAGQIVSLVGTWMQTVARAWLVYRLTVLVGGLLAMAAFRLKLDMIREAR